MCLVGAMGRTSGIKNMSVKVRKLRNRIIKLQRCSRSKIAASSAKLELLSVHWDQTLNWFIQAGKDKNWKEIKIIGTLIELVKPEVKEYVLE